MLLLFALLPLVVAVVVITALRQSAMRGALAGLVVALGLAFLVTDFELPVSRLFEAGFHGLLNSIGVVYVMLGGVSLYHVLKHSNALEALSNSIERVIPHRGHRLLGIVFGVSVFFESTTGFGVGIIVTAPLLLGMGLSPKRAALIALAGQCAIPWGGLGVGTVLGSQMSGTSSEVMGLLAAFLGLPFMVLCGLTALRLAGSKSFPSGGAVAVLIHALVLAVALATASMTVGVELAGAVAGAVALIFASYVGRNEFATPKRSPAPHNAARVARALTPFVALIGALVLVRVVPGIATWLDGLLPVELERFNFALTPLQHPGFWLVVSSLVGIVALQIRLAEVPEIIGNALKQWLPAATTVVAFLILGQIMVDAGMTGVIATQMTGLAESVAVPAVATIGALGGFLTASSSASNALFMNVQVAIADTVGIDRELAVSLQNTTSSNMTLASPGRLVFAASVAGQAGSEGELLRRIAPLALGGLATTCLMALGVQAFA